jgi:K+-sensing histidine kinase KdpD
VSSSTTISRYALVGGPLVAIAIGAATSTVRDQVGASDVGIALAIVVAGAALISRGAALTTAVAAALTFNFFHTRPYHSLRVHSPRDVAVVALLAVLGLVISDLSAWRRRREVLAHHHERAANASSTVAELLSGVHPVSEVWPAVVRSILDELGVAECGLVHERPADLPLISRSASRGTDGVDSFVLPAKGASIEVLAGVTSLGHLVVLPPSGASSLRVERRVIVSLADHIALALTYDHPVPVLRAAG